MDAEPQRAVTLDDVQAAAERLQGVALRTPLLRLDADAPPGTEIHVKLECLQPVGSFKIRGAGNALALADAELLREGVSTASAGNMALAVAWLARRHGLPVTVVMPDDAPAAKAEPLAALGARIVRVAFAEWWRTLVERSHSAIGGLFIHPVADRPVIAGNGTIGLETVTDLPDVGAIIVPFGGGGLASGIASAAKALRPGVKVFAAEVATAAPLAPSLAAGHPVDVVRTPSFVDGIGSGGILPEMWPLVSSMLDGSIVVQLDAVADAIRLLATRARVVAEGAGAAALAAALTGRAGPGKVVAVISGGNLDRATLATVLSGDLPA